jgi:hypothetical protein
MDRLDAYIESGRPSTVLFRRGCVRDDCDAYAYLAVEFEYGAGVADGDDVVFCVAGHPQFDDDTADDWFDAVVDDGDEAAAYVVRCAECWTLGRDFRYADRLVEMRRIADYAEQDDGEWGVVFERFEYVTVCRSGHRNEWSDV